MRELKFRAWDKVGKLYIDIDGFLIENETKTIRLFWKYITTSKTSFDQSFVIDRIVLEQYTPLKTKNNEFICQGDKVYIAGVGDCEIIFDGLTFEVEADRGNIIDLRDCLEDIEEIVGNIHEV